MTRFTPINSSSDKCNHELRYYPFVVDLDRCNESCDTLDYPSGRVCITNKTKDANLNVFNMITKINE